jgi:hypothetical protein
VPPQANALLGDSTAENRNASAKRERIFGGYGASRTRTGDLLGAIQALFQLSYSPATPSVARRPPE